MRLESFKPQRKGIKLGYACVRLPNGLVIADIAICTLNGNFWATLPATPIINKNGQHEVDRAGKKRWAANLRWDDRLTHERWSADVVALVREHHPEALDDGALL